MSSPIRFVIAMVVITLIGLPTLALSIVQKPKDPPTLDLQTLEMPDLPPDFKPPLRGDRDLNPQVRKRIREALENGKFDETGNAVLDETLQFIKGRRSVLEGSALDTATDEAATISEKARAAECLLKAARVLERIEPSDKTRRDLVNQLRRESVRLLTQ